MSNGFCSIRSSDLKESASSSSRSRLRNNRPELLELNEDKLERKSSSINSPL